MTTQLTSNQDHHHQVKASCRSTMETINTSTPKPPSRHREFFEKLYGSLDRNEAKSLDTSTSSDESLEKKDSTASDLSDHGPTEAPNDNEKSPPIRPFPSFPLTSSMESSRLMTAATQAGQNLPYFPPSALHHMTSGPSMEAAAAAGLRLPDFPFPGGLAAFCKFEIFLDSSLWFHFR